MKRYSTTFGLTALLLVQPLVASATVGDVLKNSVNEETVNAIQDASIDVRKQAILAVLGQAENILTQVETKLQSSEYASDQTKSDGQALIDSAQSELTALEQQVNDAATVEDLTAARQDALAWLQENKDLAKDIATDIYIDSLNAALDAETEVLTGAKALVPYYTQANLDVTTYQSLIDTAEQSVATAQSSVDTADATRSQADLEAAGKAVAQASKAVAAVLEEADNLYDQMIQ